MLCTTVLVSVDAVVVSTQTETCEQIADTDVTMETETNKAMSRKALLKIMKHRAARRTKRKTKRLGGKKSHSKW